MEIIKNEQKKQQLKLQMEEIDQNFQKLHQKRKKLTEELSSLECQHPKILSLKVEEDKLIAQLDDERESSIPLSWFAKWGVKEVTAEKLKKYEIGWGGYDIYFPEIDEDLGVEVFTEGLKAHCCHYH